MKSHLYIIVLSVIVGIAAVGMGRTAFAHDPDRYYHGTPTPGERTVPETHPANTDQTKFVPRALQNANYPERYDNQNRPYSPPSETDKTKFVPRALQNANYPNRD